MKIDFAVKVDIGPKESNDDRVTVFGENLTVNGTCGCVETPAVAVVCDGCGGYDGGYIAAETVLDVLSSESPQSLTDDRYLAEVLTKCQQKVLDKKIEMPHFSEMCTTVAGCVFSEDKIVFFHSGDSRIYRFDGQYLAKMTRDHSVVQSLVDMGQITPEEALSHPNRNIIDRCIGIDSLPPEIYVSNNPLNNGEMYLLCSDGLWESVRDDEIKAILTADTTIEEKTAQLMDRALKQGANDNISVCICASQGKIEKIESKPFILD